MRRDTGATAASCDAIADLYERQRLLRSAYVAARYGWPETLASEWTWRPERFERAEPSCRASRFLEVMAPGSLGWRV